MHVQYSQHLKIFCVLGIISFPVCSPSLPYSRKHELNLWKEKRDFGRTERAVLYINKLIGYEIEKTSLAKIGSDSKGEGGWGYEKSVSDQQHPEVCQRKPFEGGFLEQFLLYVII